MLADCFYVNLGVACQPYVSKHWFFHEWVYLMLAVQKGCLT